MKIFSLLFWLIFTIAKTHAQDYQISFAGTGASTTVDSVKVENLTQGTSLSLPGSDTLLLTATVGTYNIYTNEERVKICPNPMRGQAVLSFYAKQAGYTQLAVYDISGKEVLQINDNVSQGIQRYRITGLNKGIYFINISGENYFYISKLISLNAVQSETKIEYAGIEKSEVNVPVLKTTKAMVNMAYTTGDNMRFTGYSDTYTAIETDVPTSSEIITFTFISLPTISTTAVGAFVSNKISCGGIITNDGGSPVSVRGVCWSTSSNPTINDSITIDGFGIGTFNSLIQNVILNTTYHIRAYATNSAGTAYGNEITFLTTPLVIGQSYQGGKIAYLNITGLHGFIITSSNMSSGIQWYNGVNTITGATGMAIGTGNANTQAIVLNQGSGNYAAKLCYDLILGGYSDWYLPSLYELEKIYDNRLAIGGIPATDFYWSSTEYTINMAYCMTMSGAGYGSALKSYSGYQVRAIRSF